MNACRSKLDLTRAAKSGVAGCCINSELPPLVASLHKPLDGVSQVLLADVMISTLIAKAMRFDEHVRVPESGRCLELVARELYGQSVRVLQVDRVHEATIFFVERDSMLGQTGGGLFESRSRHVESDMID